MDKCLVHSYENGDKEMIARLIDAIGKFLK